jgi:hypothetical protein
MTAVVIVTALATENLTQDNYSAARNGYDSVGELDAAICNF